MARPTLGDYMQDRCPSCYTCILYWWLPNAGAITAMNVGKDQRRWPNINPAWDQSIVLVPLCYVSPPLTRQCVGVSCIVPMSGHCTRRWLTLKRHSVWARIGLLCGLTAAAESTAQCCMEAGQHQRRWTSVEPCYGCWSTTTVCGGGCGAVGKAVYALNIEELPL